MTDAPNSVRQMISRSIGHDRVRSFLAALRPDGPCNAPAGGHGRCSNCCPTRCRASAARLAAGPVEQRIKAMQVVQELGLGRIDAARHCCRCAAIPMRRVRSKAVSLMGEVPIRSRPSDRWTRCSTIPIPACAPTPSKCWRPSGRREYVPLLAQRARSSHNRERANAIKAMHSMRVSTAQRQLLTMLRDERPEHRISALWALRQIGWWQLLNEVGRIAKEDTNHRVRRYALGVLKNVAELMQPRRAKSHEIAARQEDEG